MRVKNTILGIIFLILLSLMVGLSKPALTEANSCDHFIPHTTTIADARTDYAAVQPGDTVCLEAGTRGGLSLRNFEGTAEQPITFANDGGLVEIISDGSSGISIANSRHFRLTGSGEPGLEYGIKIVQNRIRVGYKSSHYEIDHLETERMRIGTNPTCSNGSPHDYRGYDYDDDDDIDQNDAVNRDTFVETGVRLHHNYVHSSGFEGMYIGQAGFDTGKNLTCPEAPGGQETVFPPVMREVDIHNNLVENIGWEAIEVKSALEACSIHHNRVVNYTTKDVDADNGAIALGFGSTCDIYNNFIKEGKGAGIELTGYGDNKVYNNIIIDAGQGRIYDRGGMGIMVSNTGDPANEIYILHNTIVNSQLTGIEFKYRGGTNNLIQNNLIANPGNGVPIDTHGLSNVVVTNNFETLDIGEVHFINPGIDDYSLQPDSPAIDTGADMMTFDITTDYAGSPRPQGDDFDIGAFEVAEGVPTPEPTTEPTSEPDQVTLVVESLSNVNAAETFRVDVLAQNVTQPGLYGVQLEINYDPNLVSASNLQVNPDLSFIVMKNIDEEAGKVTFVASRQGEEAGLTGDTPLLSFDATATDSPGTATFTLENEIFSDSQAQNIELISRNHTVTIGNQATPEPTGEPTAEPTAQPSPEPTDTPTAEPTSSPTAEPTSEPTPEPTVEPTDPPTPQPTNTPTPQPTSEPTADPTDEPTPMPTPEPTDEPTLATVFGQIILTGRANNDWSEGVVTIAASGLETSTDESGNFTILEVPPGLAGSITAKAAGYLPATCSNPMVTAPETAFLPVTLLSGDINDDQTVDISDATAVGTGFGRQGPALAADLNRDEVINIFDIVLVTMNFGTEGPQTWNCQ